MSLRSWYYRTFRPSIIVDRLLVSYEEADQLIKEDPKWELAKTEDENMEIGMVWIQKREYVTA